MVKFCNKCNRAVDDLDKFCRACGQSTNDSIDYHTYYRFFMKDGNDDQPLLWFMKGAGIAFRQEIKEINDKVDRMYQKLFPPSVGELREEYERVFDKQEEKEEKHVEKPSEIEIGKKEDISLQEKDEKKEEKTDDKPPGNKEEKTDDKEGDIKKKDNLLEEKEDWPWQEEAIGEEQTEEKIPEEVNDKLGILLQEDEGQRQAVQYLIDKYAKKNKGRVEDNDKSSVDTNPVPIAIVPSEDVVRIGRSRGKGKEKGEPYKMYDVAIHPYIPDLLRSIEGSKDGIIRVRLSDIAKKMGEKFVDKKPVTIYTGLKYILFDHKIVVEMGSLKVVDPVTKENIKILKMRMKNPDDTLPPSLLERRGEME